MWVFVWESRMNLKRTKRTRMRSLSEWMIGNEMTGGRSCEMVAKQLLVDHLLGMTGRKNTMVVVMGEVEVEMGV